MNPIKEKHLALLAQHVFDGLYCADYGYRVAISSQNVTDENICAILGFERNIDDSFSKEKRAYAKKLYELELVPYLKEKMALALNLEA